MPQRPANLFSPDNGRVLWVFALLCVSVWLTLACQSKPDFTQKDIVGAWKADSIFQYTNGFVERKAVLDPDENIVYDYDSTGRLTMKKEGEQRSIQYEIIAGDSLIYRSAAGGFLVGYRILSLIPNKLVLKKKQYPLFPGPNQDVYEIRQFSPVLTNP